MPVQRIQNYILNVTALVPLNLSSNMLLLGISISAYFIVFFLQIGPIIINYPLLWLPCRIYSSFVFCFVYCVSFISNLFNSLFLFFSLFS